MYISRITKILAACDSEKQARMEESKRAAAAAAAAEAKRRDEAARRMLASCPAVTEVVVLDGAGESNETDQSQDLSEERDGAEESKAEDAVSEQARILAAKDASGNRKRHSTKGQRGWTAVPIESYELQLRGGRKGNKEKLSRKIFPRTPGGMVYCAICPNTPSFSSAEYLHNHHQKNKAHAKALAKLADQEKTKPAYQKALDLKDNTTGSSLPPPIQEFRCKGMSLLLYIRWK